MRAQLNLVAAYVSALLLLASTCANTTHATEVGHSPNVTTSEGLIPIKIRGVDEAYVQPKADLSPYHDLMLDPIEVSFRKDWNPAPAGMPISAQEKNDIREGLARVLRDAFTQEISRSGEYRIVTVPAEGVLRIKAEIRDLFINAPDLQRAGIRSYTLSVGDMSLVAELRDAPTGDLLARVIDHKRDPESVWLELTTRVENVASAERAAVSWAQTLHRELDAAHQITH